MSDATTSEKVVSSWCFLPIFFRIIGDLIAWIVTKDDDQVRPKSSGYLEYF